MIHDRLHCDPEETCIRCGGCGFVRWFDADLGWVHGECPLCDGKARTGVFVVRLLTRRFRYEFHFHTDAFAKSCRYADRAAARFANRVVLGYEPTEVDVVFLPTDETAREVSVYARSVGGRSPERAA